MGDAGYSLRQSLRHIQVAALGADEPAFAISRAQVRRRRFAYTSSLLKKARIGMQHRRINARSEGGKGDLVLLQGLAGTFAI